MIPVFALFALYSLGGCGDGMVPRDGVSFEGSPVAVRYTPTEPCAPSPQDGAGFVPFAPPLPAAGQPSGVLGDRAGWGVAVDDFDGDGWLDVFLPHHGTDQLFLWRDGRLVDTSDHLPAAAYDTFGVVGGDLDGDGDVDLVLANLGPDAVWLNDGEGRFAEVGTAEETWGEVADWRTQHITLGDVDGDGVLDAFAPTFYLLDPAGSGEELLGPNALYLGQGDGTFVPAPIPEVARWTPANTAGFVDVDEDGHLDLFLINDKPGAGYESGVFLNDGEGGLEAASPELGLRAAIQGMGLAEGDLNDDGHMDFAISGWDEVALLVSEGDVWAQEAAARGVETGPGRRVGWGIELFDADLDGDLDLLEAFGPDFDSDGVSIGMGPVPNHAQQEWGFWRQDGGAFVESGAQSSLGPPGNRRGFVVADLDRNGHPEVISRDISGVASIGCVVCTDQAWLTVSLEQPNAMNRRAIGAEVAVTTATHAQRRAIRSGTTNIASSAPPVASFGLGGAARVESVSVRWPDGAETELGPIPVDRILTIIRQ
jgi:enediyne biosynthesis protein E4